MHWAHCEFCRSHFTTRTGFCPECRAEDTYGCDQGAEKGCEECIEIAQLEIDLKNARVKR